MENTELTALVSEMRAEFQIPPYYEDSQLEMCIRDSVYTACTSRLCLYIYRGKKKT